MKTSRPLSINNSLAHGICNYTCRLCSIHRDGFQGPKEFQPRAVTARLIERIREAGQAGIHVRYVTNAGDGEPTLHPEFTDRMAMFGEMLRTWDALRSPEPAAPACSPGPAAAARSPEPAAAAPFPPAPEVAVVTNGSRLMLPGILDSIVENGLTLIVSFPSSRPETYGTIMAGRPEKGQVMLERVLPGLQRAMTLRAEGRLRRLCLHISPPERDLIRHDFPETLDTLTRMASSSGLEQLELMLFPATSNRSGLIRNRVTGMDVYRDYFRRYHGQKVNGVEVKLDLVIRRFFQKPGEMLDVLRSFRFPCLWNANFFFAPDGTSICPNDQAMRQPLGNLTEDGIEVLMERKEAYGSGLPCVDCDQAPHRMHGSMMARAYALGASVKMHLAR